MDHDTTLHRHGDWKQWRCTCGWTGTVVLYGNAAAHIQAALAAIRHTSHTQEDEQDGRTEVDQA